MFDLADDLPGGVTPAQTVDVTEKAVTADEKGAGFRKSPKNPEQASVLSPAPPSGMQPTIAPWHLYPVRVEKIQYSKWVARILLPRAGVTAKALGGLGTELLREVCISSAGAPGKMGVWGRCQALLTPRSNRLATSGSVWESSNAYLHVLADRLDFPVPSGKSRSRVGDRLVTGRCAWSSLHRNPA